ncbi:MAG: hypothetical protein ABIS59_04270 [Candidatus Saccharibacteria bacterium]
MQQNNEDQVRNMESGDTWYFDEFGEYRNASLHDAEADDLMGNAATDDTITPGSSTTDALDASMLNDDEFNETLASPHIEDQLNDASLQDEAEAEYHPGEDKSIMDKVKEKFDDLT